MIYAFLTNSLPENNGPSSQCGLIINPVWFIFFLNLENKTGDAKMQASALCLTAFS